MRTLMQIRNHNPTDDMMLLLSLGYAILDSNNVHIKIPKLIPEKPENEWDIKAKYNHIL